MEQITKDFNLKAWACIRQFSYPVKNKVHHFLQAVDKNIWQIVDETQPPPSSYKRLKQAKTRLEKGI